MQLKSLNPNLGLEIKDVDLATLSDADFDRIEGLFNQHMVLVFRDQTLSREQHKAFAKRFGDIHIHPSHRGGMKGKGDDPELFVIDTPADSKITNGELWHSDVSCEVIPPMASLLYITQTPDNGGGDTLFADMCSAFSEMSEALQKFLIGKVAVHDGEVDLANYNIRLRVGQEYPKASHPIIVEHPATGKPVLFVNPSFTSHIKGLKQWESRMILEGIHRFVATNARIQCRVNWQPNTLVIWDNRCVQHQAIRDYAGFPRYGERVSVVPTVAPKAFNPKL